jgi:hypothetical protein
MKFAHRAFSGYLPFCIYALTMVSSVSVGVSRLEAQSSSVSGRLEGYVIDATGGSVAGATVTARNTATGEAPSQQTDERGHFLFLYLSPSHYDVSIEKAGFAPLTMHDVVINVGTTSTLRPQLALGTIESIVSVTAEAPLVDTSQSALASVVSRQSVEELPLSGRNFTDFALLTPGATTDGSDGMISFNGIAGNFNNYTVDGGNNNNAFFSQQMGRTSIPYQFSEDVIQEFQVNSTGFQAEFGQAGGGIVNTVTRSGTNDLHGDAYYYVLDSALDANDPINNSRGILKPHNRRQQFGGTVGGPIHRDKIFYLVNYEGQDRNEPISVNDALVAATLADPTFVANNPGIVAQVQAAAGSFPRSFNQNVAFGKVTAVLNEKNTLNATYNYQRFRSPHGYFSTPISTGDGLSLTDGATSQFFQISLQSMINSSMTNEFRFHYGNDFHFDMPSTPPTGPAVVIQNPDSGFVFGGNRFQLSTADRRYEFSDSLTKLLGKHTMKFGVDINYSHDSDYFLYGPKGVYQFGSLADVATGNYQLYFQSFGQTTAEIHSPTYSVFAQDQFRVSPKLTLNYGLRYDLQVLPQPPVCNPNLALTCHINYAKKNVAPRVGFAYSLDAKGTTVVRASFGLYYEQEDLLDTSQALLSNGVSRPFLVATGPAFKNPSPVVTYPNSLTTFPGSGSAPSVVVFAPNFRSPYVEQANLAVEHQLGAHTSVSLGYVYSHGLALLGNSNGVTRQALGNGSDLNLVPPALQTQPLFGGSQTTDTVMFPNGTSVVVPDYSAIDGIYNPNFGAINVIDNTGLSIYNGLLVSVRHTSSQFFASAAYTFSKLIDQGTGYYNQFDQQSERGPSQLDQRHRFVLDGGWTPTSGFMRHFIFAGILNVASGRPYTAIFDTSQLNFGMVPGEGFNSFTGPGVEDFDFSVARDVHLSERFTLRIKAESFDLFNHANYQQSPVTNIQYTTAQNSSGVWIATLNPAFGSPVATPPRSGSRAFQFSTRFSF